MLLQVGMEVKVREDLQRHTQYHMLSQDGARLGTQDSVNEVMIGDRGKIKTITSIAGRASGDKYRLSGSNWYWTDEMFDLDYTTNLEYTCSDCGEKKSFGELKRTPGGKLICEHCYEESTFECPSCGEIHFKVDAVLLNDEMYCEDCVVECEDCGEIHLRSESVVHNVRNWRSNTTEYYCENCVDSNFTPCDDCGELTHNDELREAPNGEEYCNHCYDENVFCCAECDEHFMVDDAVDIDDTCYCEHCAERINLIRGYYYKPTPIFFGDADDDLYLGVELEIDDPKCNASEVEDVAKDIKDVVSNEEIYLKRDGSLDGGVEIVTHPCTLDYQLNSLGWDDILDTAKEHRYLSHKTKTCGLHVHLSKKAFGENTLEIENTIAKMILFTERNWAEVLKFSRRTQKSLDDWARRYLAEDSSLEEYDDIDVAKEKLFSYSGRYKTINLCNQHTVEIRFFRGTLKEETFKASLEFTVAMLEIAKNHSLDEILRNNFTDYMETFEKFDYIVPYLEEREII